MPPGRTALAALTCVAALTLSSAAALFPLTARAGEPHAIVPPSNPQYSVDVGRYNPSGCSGVSDFSGNCLRESLGMINAGRKGEGLGPLLLPANWQALTVAQQLFVLTELERGARGLPIDTGLYAGLNDDAVSGADAGRDPTGGGIAALWAGGEPNSIVVMADWIYEDGLFSDGFAENLNCTAAAPVGCWQHRDILLHDSASGLCSDQCAVGAGYSPGGYSGAAAAGTGSDSYAEVFAGKASGAQTFSWSSELAQLPLCERSGDSCGWTGRPVATTSGIQNVATSSKHTPANVKPWFATAVSSEITVAGRLVFTVHVGIRLRGVTVVAHQAGAIVRFRVRRQSRFSYLAIGSLTSGKWTVRIRYLTLSRSWRRPTSAMQFTSS